MNEKPRSIKQDETFHLLTLRARIPTRKHPEAILSGKFGALSFAHFPGFELCEASPWLFLPRV